MKTQHSKRVKIVLLLLFCGVLGALVLGSLGLWITLKNDKVGPQGMVGAQGKPGQDGAQGPQGPPGEPGKNLTQQDGLLELVDNKKAYQHLEWLVNLNLDHTNSSEDQQELAEKLNAKMGSFGIANDKEKSMRTYSYISWKTGANKKTTNLMYIIPGSGNQQERAQTIVIGVDYNNPTKGVAQNFNDNHSGIALLLALAEYLAKNPLRHTVYILFWDQDLEDTDRARKESGSTRWFWNYFLENHKHEDLLLHINLDEVAGGDHLYVGHGPNDTDPKIQNINRQNFIKILELARQFNFEIQASNPTDVKTQGELKRISSWKIFDELSIPTIGFGSTNFAIASKPGESPGYSQTTDEKFWYPQAAGVSEEQKALGIRGGPLNQSGVNPDGYPRAKEAGWGVIRGTKNDNFTLLNAVQKTRLQNQLTILYLTIVQFLQKYQTTS